MQLPETETEAWRDPIVEEVRAARQALLAACDGDLAELCKRLREQQSAGDRRVVSRPPRDPKQQGTAA